MTLSGFLVINKDAGISSHSVVSRVRRLTGQKKAGHTGTLDPFATGVLPVALGDATKAIQFLDETYKEYRAVMRLGESTDTQDFTGKVLTSCDCRHVTAANLHDVASQFTGAQMQIPPMYSAIKQAGVPLYRIARKGGEVTREARSIFIDSIVVEMVKLPDVAIRVRCSRGTYIRTLAHDMGKALGCWAHLVSLARTVSGPFTLESAVTLDQLAEIVDSGGLNNVMIPAQRVLSHLRSLELDEASANRLFYGIAPGKSGVISGEWPGYGERVLLQKCGSLLAVGEGVSAESVRLVRVFV